MRRGLAAALMELGDLMTAAAQLEGRIVEMMESDDEKEVEIWPIRVKANAGRRTFDYEAAVREQVADDAELAEVTKDHVIVKIDWRAVAKDLSIGEKSIPIKSQSLPNFVFYMFGAAKFATITRGADDGEQK